MQVPKYINQFATIILLNTAQFSKSKGTPINIDSGQAGQDLQARDPSYKDYLPIVVGSAVGVTIGSAISKAVRNSHERQYHPGLAGHPYPQRNFNSLDSESKDNFDTKKNGAKPKEIDSELKDDSGTKKDEVETKEIDSGSKDDSGAKEKESTSSQDVKEKDGSAASNRKESVVKRMPLALVTRDLSINGDPKGVISIHKPRQVSSRDSAIVNSAVGITEMAVGSAVFNLFNGMAKDQARNNEGQASIENLEDENYDGKFADDER